MPKLSTIDALKLALEQHRAGNFQAAEAVYRKVLVHDADNADALHLLGVLLRQTGRVRTGIDLLHRAVGLNRAGALCCRRRCCAERPDEQGGGEKGQHQSQEHGDCWASRQQPMAWRGCARSTIVPSRVAVRTRQLIGRQRDLSRRVEEARSDERADDGLWHGSPSMWRIRSPCSCRRCEAVT